MKKCFRGHDSLFRFGGEEFVVILKATDSEGARVALERFRDLVERFMFPGVGDVTVSLGYRGITDVILPAEILAQADEALYYAKEHGRNQVRSYEQLVSEGAFVNKEQAKQKSEVELFC